MAFTDILVFVVFVGVVGAVIYGVMLASKSIDAGVASTRESLKAKGLDVSATGVSMRSNKKFDRQDYLDATQRGIINVMEASSFRKNVSPDGSSSHPPTAVLERSSSHMSTNSTSSIEKKKKKSLFSSKKRVDS